MVGFTVNLRYRGDDPKGNWHTTDCDLSSGEGLDWAYAYRVSEQFWWEPSYAPSLTHVAVIFLMSPSKFSRSHRPNLTPPYNKDGSWTQEWTGRRTLTF